MADLDPLLHQPTRLRIMTYLVQNRLAAATTIRDALGLTDGNLGSHLERLERAKYLEVRRRLRALGFEVEVAITVAGNEAFQAYLRALRALMEDMESAQRGDVEGA